ncbi:hypothetical protein GCM10011351_25750 [Paraliobacillus quinghaiensis]|uniref:Uncharacterized protein n=1 Tax=Paraliobacillus quinghaiensis TaxID=470815 RepID=A0A917TUJ3_9BACI|nr:hypothetical protein [Paraliobacillus quinghaiensis]GGM38519.1 hypothetical protein GCM10011351_25750 [Paraliobacillus quinghaiensis]
MTKTLEEQKLKEEQERIRDEEQRSKQDDEKRKAKSKADEEESLKKRERIQKLDDEQVEREMQERARIAATRPVDVHPYSWDYRTKSKNQYSNYANQKTSTGSKLEKTEDKIDKKKREDLLELLLSQLIKGELYIDGDSRNWRRVLLKWIKKNQTDGTLVVSLQNIIDYMKNSGISFNQNDSIVKYPIKDFFELYVRISKSELKRKIELSIQD